MSGRSPRARPLAAAALLTAVLAPAAVLAGTGNAAASQHTAVHVPAPRGFLAVGHQALEWTSVSAATGFDVVQATNQAMTRGVKRSLIRGPGHQFTPYGLTKGTTYYFKVRALEGSASSAYTPVVHFTATMLEQPVTVMTYNILQDLNDGTTEGGNVIAPWADRRPGQVTLIKQVEPDLIAIQEGAAWVGAPGGVRQVDSLVAGLGAPYALADTEIPPSLPHFFRTGVYIIYNTTTYAPVGDGNHVDIGDERYAAYQEFRNLKTGAKVLFVASHLLVGKGHADDLAREAETETLAAFGTSLGRVLGVPVVFAGDFNSASTKDKNFTLDGAGIAMRAADAADALSAAQQRTNATANSANGYQTTPTDASEDIDHIFAPPGIGVRSAGIDIDLTDGHFVGVIPSDHNPVYAGLLFPY